MVRLLRQLLAVFKARGRCEEMVAYLNSDKSTLNTFGFPSVASLCFTVMALER